MKCSGSVTAYFPPHDGADGFRHDFFELARTPEERDCGRFTRVYSSCPTGWNKCSGQVEHVIAYDRELSAWTISKVGSDTYIWRTNDVKRGNVTGAVACPEMADWTWYERLSLTDPEGLTEGKVRGALVVQTVPTVDGIPPAEEGSASRDEIPMLWPCLRAPKLAAEGVRWRQMRGRA